MAKREKVQIAIDGVLDYYKSLTEPQLAVYHRVPRGLIHSWKEGLRGEPRAEESIQNVIHVGALGSGKSAEQRFGEIALSCLIPDNYGVIVRKRWEELLNHVYDDLLRAANSMTGGMADHLMSKPKKVGASYEIIVYTTSAPSRIIIKPEVEGTPEQIATHFKGPEYGWCSLEELDGLQEITWDTLIGRLRRKFFKLFTREAWEQAGWPVVLGEHDDPYFNWVAKMSSYLWAAVGVCNPPYDGHWVDRRTKKGEAEEAREELKRGSTLVVRSCMEDNVRYLGRDYIDAQKELYKDDPVQYDMLILGRNGIRIGGVPVYGKQFRSDLHTSETLMYNPFKPLLVGLDFGFLRPVAVFAQEDADGCLNILGELCPENKSAEQFGELIWDYIQQYFPKLQAGVSFFGDHAGTQRTDKGETTIERLAGLGIDVMSQPLDLDDSLNSVRRLLTHMMGEPLRPRLMLHRSNCPILTQAMIGGYYYKMTQGQREPKPYKTSDNHMDDVCDALRYLIANCFGSVGESRTSAFVGVTEGPVFATGIGGYNPGEEAKPQQPRFTFGEDKL
jgi:hypothetical protein